MGKKLNTLLGLSATALVAGIGAQFYTNYQIDQTLSRFPYQLKDQFSISITENNSDFFTRDLIFNLEKSGEKTPLIHTKLTALPLMLSAESHLDNALIKQLNSQLNITIDKNTITNQFLVFNKNLSSTLQTEFRDGTNKPQTLEAELVYSNNKKTIELQTQLSGFNYEKTLSLKDVTGNFSLIPVENSLYDVSKIDLRAKKTDINLLDGDNTHIGIVKGRYLVDKKIHQQDYDFNQKFETSGIYFSDKNTKSDEDKPRLEGVSFQSKNIGMPSNLDFASRLKELENNPQNFQVIGKYFIDLLFNNKQFETALNIEYATHPKEGVTLKNGKFGWQLNNENQDQSTQKMNFALGRFTITPDGSRSKKNNLPSIEMKELNVNLDSTNFNIKQELDFFTKFLPKNLVKLSTNSKAFFAELKVLAKNMKYNTEGNISLKQLAVKDHFLLEDLSSINKDNTDRENMNGDFQLNIGKIILYSYQAQFNKTKIAFPYQAKVTPEFYQAYLCTNSIYRILCDLHFSPAKETDYLAEIAKLAINIPDATLRTELDTYPKATENLPVQANFNLTKGASSQYIDTSSVELKATVTAPLNLVKQPKPQTEFWYNIQQSVAERFIENEKDYSIEIIIENDKTYRNGQRIE